MKSGIYVKNIIILQAILFSFQEKAIPQEPILLVDKPIPLFASLDQKKEGLYEMTFHIGGLNSRQYVHSLTSIESLNLTVDNLRREIRWVPPYLFVRSISSGNCWDCTGTAIFEINRSITRRIGDLNLYDRAAEIPWRDGYFFTTYTKFEREQGLCAACAPRFLIRLSVNNYKFVVSKWGTWEINHDLIMDNNRTILNAVDLRQGRHPDATPPNVQSSVVRSLLENTALAKYCEMKNDLEILLNQAKIILDEPRLSRFYKEIDSVIPGESPENLNKKSPY